MNEILDTIYSYVTISSFIKFTIWYFFVIWFALILWVVKDIFNRTDNILFRISCILLVLVLTPLWVFVYLLIRPSKTINEKYYDEIEDNLDIIKEIIDERLKKKKD